MDYLRMFKDVGKIGMKYYVSFHLIPLVLRLRKCKDREQVIKLLGKTGVEYVRSILFMIFLVTGMKAGLCFTTQNRISFLGTYQLTKVNLSLLRAFSQHQVFSSNKNQEESKLVIL